jgi:hypothetical protein
MSDKLDQDLDELLSRHLHACLDGQLGRASAALAEELAPRWRWRLWLAAGTAVAAGLTVAILMLTHNNRRSPVFVTPINPESPAIAQVVPPMVQSASWSKMIDDGTTVIADRPMRKMSRKVVEEVEWYDAPNRAMVKTTLPQQEIYLIEMKTN